jgi:hypothetical protein
MARLHRRLFGFPGITVVDKLVIPHQGDQQRLLSFLAPITGKATPNRGFVMRQSESGERMFSTTIPEEPLVSCEFQTIFHNLSGQFTRYRRLIAAF